MLDYRAFAISADKVEIVVPASVIYVNLLPFMIHSQHTHIIFEGDPHLRIGTFGTAAEELCRIAQMMGSRKGVCFEEEALAKLTAAFEAARKQSDFGNGRYVRDLLEQAKMNQASRLLSYDFDAVTAEEIKTIKAVDIVIPEVKTEVKRTIGFAC